MTASLRVRCRSLLPQKKTGKEKRNSRNTIKVKAKQKAKVRDLETSRIKKSFKYQRALLLLFMVLFVFGVKVQASCREGIMISEIYGGGGNSGALYKNDFIELFNNSNFDINLSGWTVQYTAGNGLFTNANKTLLNGKILAKKHYLIEEKNGAGGSINLPMPDAQGNIAMSVSAGKIALVDNTDVISNKKDGNVVDFVGYGSANEYEEKSAKASDNTHSIARKSSICLDSNDNSEDFTPQDPTPGSENEKIIPVCQGDIVLSEIFPFEGEFVEVENLGTEKCDLAGWRISDQANGARELPADSVIDMGKYFAFVKDFGLNSTSVDGVKLFNSNDVMVEERSYQKPPSEDFSFSKDKNEKWSWTIKTPGEKNVFKDDTVIEDAPDVVTEKKTYSDKIQITELFPNPFKSQYEEYIELYNSSLESVDLTDWMLRDATKSGKYTFPAGIIIKAQEYLAVFKKDFKFALNNSGKESVLLVDPNGKEITKAEYDGSKRNVSYNFDGARWRWSKFLTPGIENILNNEPYGKIKIDDDIYKKVYADFLVSTGDADGDKVKVIWDFGDGHKSYLAKTRHKYDKEGKYEGSVKLSDGSEDIVKTFVINVKKFPHPKVRIVAINANPKGKDSVFETVTIENKSKEKINLDGWGIATGSKKLSNHPITEKFNIKKKEIKEINREFSKFSLNNKKGKIELRYPDGEVADKVEYDHGKVSIDEDEKYIKTKNGWSWAAVPKPITQNLKPEIQKTEMEIKVKAEIAGVETVKREYSFVMVEKSISIGKMEFNNFDSRVHGAESVREIDGRYFFVTQSREQQHYVVSFLKNGYFALNSKLNYILTRIFN